MSVTPRIGAPELPTGQDISETTANEITRYLEAVAARVVVDKDRTVPAGTEVDGDCFIVPASPTGAWTGKAGNIAVKVSTAWVFIAPWAGLTFYVQDEAINYRYASGAWAAVAGGGTAASLDYDTDGTLAANSDSKIATQKAVRTFVTSTVAGLLDYQGDLDCSANPNYPAASKGDAYTVSVAGKVGGGSGISVDIGDTVIAKADNAGGTQASVGASWFLLEHNLAGALLAANNLSDVASAATARSNIGATTVGGNVFTLPNPSAVRYLRVNADNSVDLLDAAAFRAAIGAGTGSGGGDMVSTNNLSDVANAATAAHNLGLGTADSPQLTGLNIGHATDTTVTRASAGDIAVEGNIIYRAGGTDVPVTDGGTGSSTAAGARTNLDAACRTPQIQSVSSSATVTPTFADDQVIITAQAAGLTLANPTGTALDGWGWWCGSRTMAPRGRSATGRSIARSA
jgi:hypothetical protein